VVVETTVHYRHGDRLYAYAPYAREIDIWAELFASVLIAAPCRTSEPPGDCSPFTRSNIAMHPLVETGGTTIGAKAVQVASLPHLVWNLAAALSRADAIHVRCPGNCGLIGSVIAPLFSRRLIAKYTGRWSGFDGEPWSWRLQRAILRSRWWRGPVTVYGRWPAQPPHVEPFFTSMLTEAQLVRAAASARRPRPWRPLRLLYVGRLSKEKNVDVLLHAVAGLAREGVDLRCAVVGAGGELGALQQLASALGLEGLVEFTGGVAFERVLDFYERSDVLVLASQSEAWGKALSEAMAFGLICVGTNRGLPDLLADGRGVLVPPRDLAALTSALAHIARHPECYAGMRRRAGTWARRQTLEGLRAALETLLARSWDVAWEPRAPRVDLRREA
jgi:glycosyltransferase involved in cell wall biosynthesis